MFFVCFWWEERYFLNFCLQIPEIVPTQVQIVFYTLSATIKIYKKKKKQNSTIIKISILFILAFGIRCFILHFYFTTI